MNTAHIVSAFDRDLEAAQALVMRMGGLVEAGIGALRKAAPIGRMVENLALNPLEVETLIVSLAPHIDAPLSDVFTLLRGSPARRGVDLALIAQLYQLKRTERLQLLDSLDPERPLYVLQYQYPEERALGRPYTREEYMEWSAKYVELMRSVQSGTRPGGGAGTASMAACSAVVKPAGICRAFQCFRKYGRSRW